MLATGQILGFLLAATLLLRKKNRSANQFLAVLILVVTYHQALWYYAFLHPELRFNPIFRTGFPLSLLGAVSLFLYVRRMSQVAIHWMHFLPVVAALLFVLFLRDTPITRTEIFIRVAIVISTFVFYGFACVPYLRVFRHQTLKANLSNIDKIRYRWLLFLFVLVYSAVAIGFLEAVMMEEWGIRGLTTLTATLFNVGITAFALYFSPLFSLESGSKELKFMSSEVLSAKKNELEVFFKNEKPYLQPDLTLKELADAVNLKPYQLTEVLNRGFEMSFCDLINRYRVETVKQNLLNPAFSHMNLLGIAFESGFSSKSTFNEMFRKFTGMTPSAFQRSAKNSDVQIS